MNMAKNNKLAAQSKAEKAVFTEISEAVKQAVGKNLSRKAFAIDYPPNSQMGDYFIPCFLLGKRMKKSPAEVAGQLAEQIKPGNLIKEVKAAGPYLNFFINQAPFNELILKEIAKRKDKYGASRIGKGEKVMVEYFSPNTNKPLTIGHLRNICLGASIAQLLKFVDYKVIQSTLYNDRGIAIAKAILGYQKWGNEKSPKDAGLKPDHYVGSFYIKFCQEAKNDPNLDHEAQRVLQAWEKGQKEIKTVWQKLMIWVLAGFKETLAKLGVNQFDEEYYESEYYQEGKEIVERGLKQGVFVKNPEGVILAPLEKYGLPDKIVLRPDETSLYITQDLYLGYLKDKHKLDKSVYVVGSEQDMYFKQLFKILELLGFASAQNYRHLSYGMIRLATGKIKSREGLVPGTGADELIAELEEMVKAEIKKREPELAEAELSQRATQIALGALKYYILTVAPTTTMVFDPGKSIALVGKTGPYLQYVHARISSIFTKEKIKKVSPRIDYARLADPLELELAKLLAKLPAVIANSVNDYDPSILANYLFDLAKAFSLYYEKVPILQAEPELKKARLLLVADIRQVLATGLKLLGITPLEKM
jgi:arginyl-tRNA synthetase